MIRAAVFGVGLAVALAAALWLRLPGLDERPVHADESVHFVKTGELLEHGRYEYDPSEYHGPTLYYAALPILFARRLSYESARPRDYRLAPALCGALMLLCLGLLADGLGRRASLAAAALLALSPVLVFYSRAYIQETLLAVFTLLAVGCGWRLTRRPCRAWAVATGVAVGLMLATKETAVLSLLCAAPAVWFARRSGPLPCAAGEGRGGGLPEIAPDDPAPLPASPRSAGGGGLIALSAACALATAWLFLSGWFTAPLAPLGYLHSFAPWLHRAGDAELHRHPVWYYEALLVWARRGTGARSPVMTEGFTVAFAVLGIARASRPLPRFLAVFTLLQLAAYSLIPYKTPWCVLTPLTGLALLAGCGVQDVLLFARRRWYLTALGLLVFAAGAGHLGREAWLATRKYEQDDRNPYAYAPTAPDVADVEDVVERLLAVAPQGRDTVVQVSSLDDYCWPLPWYLRRAHNVGWYVGPPPEPFAPLVLAVADVSKELGAQLETTHESVGFYGLRRKLSYELWVEKGLWRRLPTGPRPGA
ncbi:MAG: TIGR03663 family protein [Armatimonadetes bacterium]|nr:TIGR03663 family protein [Armatimonadota bacterium]